MGSAPRQDPHSPVPESSTLQRRSQVHGSHCCLIIGLSPLPRYILKVSSTQPGRGIALGGSSFGFNYHFRGRMKMGLPSSKLWPDLGKPGHAHHQTQSCYKTFLGQPRPCCRFRGPWRWGQPSVLFPLKYGAWGVGCCPGSRVEIRVGGSRVLECPQQVPCPAGTLPSPCSERSLGPLPL